MTVLDFMSKDHDRLDNIFKEFRSIKVTNKDRKISLFHDFKVGLQKHIVWEEEILFPLFENKTGMHDSGPTAVMRMEHREIKNFLEKIHASVGRNIQTSHLEDGLIEILTEHNNKEENILYPWIDNSVSDEEIEKLFKEMKNLPPEKYNKCCDNE